MEWQNLTSDAKCPDKRFRSDGSDGRNKIQNAKEIRNMRTRNITKSVLQLSYEWQKCTGDLFQSRTRQQKTEEIYIGLNRKERMENRNQEGCHWDKDFISKCIFLYIRLSDRRSGMWTPEWKDISDKCKKYLITGHPYRKR